MKYSVAILATLLIALIAGGHQSAQAIDCPQPSVVCCPQICSGEQCVTSSSGCQCFLIIEPRDRTPGEEHRTCPRGMTIRNATSQNLPEALKAAEGFTIRWKKSNCPQVQCENELEVRDPVTCQCKPMKKQ